MEGKLEFFDNLSEWFYEKKNGVGILYVMIMDGKFFEDRNIRGKVNYWLIIVFLFIDFC